MVHWYLLGLGFTINIVDVMVVARPLPSCEAFLGIHLGLHQDDRADELAVE